MRGREADLTRRQLVAAAAAGGLGLSGALRVVQALAAEPAFARASAPADAVRATMAAFADTIVPGPAGGGDESPGAVEAGVVDELYDPFYGVADALPGLHLDLQAQTPRILGRPERFDLALPYPDRERVVAERMTEAPRGGTNPYHVGYQAIGVLVYLTYYGTARSQVGPEVIGLPTYSDGYWPRHSNRVRFRGMTRNGNPR